MPTRSISAALPSSPRCRSSSRTSNTLFPVFISTLLPESASPSSALPCVAGMMCSISPSSHSARPMAAAAAQKDGTPGTSSAA